MRNFKTLEARTNAPTRTRRYYGRMYVGTTCQ